MKKALLGLCLFVSLPVLAADPVPLSARQTFHRLCRLLGQKRVDEARGLMLQADELASFARWKFDRKKYREQVEGFLRGFGAELSGGVHLRRAEAADALILPVSEKNSREVVMVVVHADFDLPGSDEPSRAVPFFLVRHAGAWKLWLR